MLGLSYPLWIETKAFPRVPFTRGLPEVSPRASWVLYATLLVSIAVSTAGFARKGALGVALLVLTALVVQDQHRLQPWAYQFFLLGLCLATLDEERVLRYARWWFVALYAYSGLSKLDASFVEGMGDLFLSTALAPFGVSVRGWPSGWRAAAILAMPAWEILVAVALLVPGMRRAGLAGALALHAALLLVLGPWGLRHSPIVLAWNVAMMIEVAIVFAPRIVARAEAPGKETRLGPLTRLIFWLAVILPLGEPWGWLDAWPAHALYASHVERVDVYLHEDDRGRLPAELDRSLAGQGEGPWRRLDLTAWSRGVRGVPVYPSGRACNGLAEALAARYGGRLAIRVIRRGRADRWTGLREREEALGLEAIRRLGGRYRLNAHPEGAYLGPPGGAGDGPARPGLVSPEEDWRRGPG